MGDQKLVLSRQIVSSQAMLLNNDVRIYISTHNHEHREAIIRRVVAIVDSCHDIIEDLYKDQLSKEITQHVEAVNKERAK